jgi:hypothetical protein
MRIRSKLFMASLLFTFLSLNANLDARFRTIDSNTGLEWDEFDMAGGQASLHDTIIVLRIDPQYYEFALLSASEYDLPAQTLKQWCKKFGYEIAFNAGMYAEDKTTTIGYCKNYDHIINPWLNRHKAVLAFNPNDTGSVPVRIINRSCEDFDSLKGNYNTFLQSIRMLGCDGGNTWNPSREKHSILAIAEDSTGHILILFSQAPVSVHDFIDRVIDLKLGITDMMYLEGSFQAGLVINTSNFRRLNYGVIEDLWPIKITSDGRIPLPNVIAVRKKKTEDD